MSRRNHEDLDGRIRRAWPITCDTPASPSSATQRMRTRIDERIAAGAAPDAPHTGTPSRRPAGVRSRRHVATVLAGAIVAASVLALGVLVAGRLGLQDQSDEVEFADEPAPGVADEASTHAPDDPDAHVRAAVAATRRAAADLTVREAERQWEDADMRNVPDADAFVEQTAPAQESTSVRTANGDWSYTDQWNTPGRCDNRANCPGAMRFVGGRYYERGHDEQAWEHVVSDDGRALADAVRDVLGDESRVGAKVRDGQTIVDLLERYDVGWSAVPGSGGGATRYRMADADSDRRLAMELLTGRVRTEGDARDLEEVAGEGTMAVHVWIDDETGLVQRVLSEQSVGKGTRHAWIMRNDIVITQEDGSVIETPERATDVPLDEWCARDRSPIWREAAGWTTVCGSL